MKDYINPLWQYDNKINSWFKRTIVNLTEPNYCNKKYGFSFPWWKKNSIVFPVISAINWYIIAIAVLFVIACFVSPVSAAQTMNSSVTVNGTTDTTLTFNVVYKTTVRATGATFDGTSIEGFDLLHNTTYVAKDLEPNTSHTFCIYKDLINCETATTTETKNSLDYIFDYVWQFILIISIIVCLTLAIKNSIVGFVAFILSLIGIIQTLNSYVLIGNLEFSTFIMGTIYGILAIAAIFVTFNK